MPMAARDDARPEFNPKHRIVGAIVLVALVVIFVPLILSEREPPPELKGARATPRAEVIETKTVVTPVPVEEPESQESTRTVKMMQVPIEPKPVTETKPAPPAEKPVATKKPEPAPTRPAAEKIENGWMVQVGTFTNIENATRLRDRLKKLGHVVHTDAVTVGGKKAMRLRVGPFAERARADKAQVQIRRETGVAGVVQSPT